MPKPQHGAGSECAISLQGAGGSGGAGPQSTSQSQLAASLQQSLPAATGGEPPISHPTNTHTLGGSGDPTDGPIRAWNAEDHVCACQCHPSPHPCVALTLFCSVFRLHPPSFLFVLALDSPPRGCDSPPHRFTFQFSTTMALAPACPLPAGEGCR